MHSDFSDLVYVVEYNALLRRQMPGSSADSDRPRPGGVSAPLGYTPLQQDRGKRKDQPCGQESVPREDVGYRCDAAIF